MCRHLLSHARGPHEVAFHLVEGRHGVRIAVCRVHAPTHVGAGGDRHKGGPPIPRPGPEGPSGTQEVGDDPRAAERHSGDSQIQRQISLGSDIPSGLAPGHKIKNNLV